MAKIIAEQGNPGHSKIKVIVDNIIHDNVVMMYKNFDMQNPLGLTTIEIINGKLYITLNDSIIEDFYNLYPAIGFILIKSHTIDDTTIVDKCKIICIGLCSSPNNDDTILTIKEQLCRTK